MSRYLLDTSIISNVTKPAPSEFLLTWMAEQPDESLFISSLSIAQIWRGVLEKPAGRKRDQLETWFAGPEGPLALFAGRALAFDEKASLMWGRLMWTVAGIFVEHASAKNHPLRGGAPIGPSSTGAVPERQKSITRLQPFQETVVELLKVLTNDSVSPDDHITVVQ